MEKGRESPKHESKGRRLVLFPIPLQGHMNPMLQLANILHATGFFSITIIHTHFNSPTISNYPHFTFCPIPDGLSETESEASTSDSVALLSLLNTNCVAAFRDCLAELVLSGVEDEAKEPIACLITDAIWHFSQSVADSLEIPTIVLRTSSLSSSLAFAALPLLLEKGYLPKQGFFSITIIHTHFNSPTISNYPHFTFCPIPDGLSETESEASTSDSVALLSLLNTNCVAAFRDCLAGLVLSGVEDEAKEPIACLITDAIWHFSQSVADSLEIPRIVLRTSSLSSFLAFAALPLLLEKGYLPKQDSQLESPVLELPPLKVKDLPTISTRNHEVFYKLIGSMVEETKASSGIIWNSMEDLEQSTLATVRQVFPVPSFPIGPFHNYFPASSSSLLAQDKSSISWLDTQPPKSVLYVSFGSIASMDEAEFLEMAWGLANSGQPFLWVMVNARYVSDVWRIGLQFESGMERGVIEKAIRRLMVEKEGEEEGQRILCLKEKVGFCLKQGGSSHHYLESLISYILSF
ncbi:UDP-glycosyltransferase 76B1 [Camellia lanceoleosa]|uniref:UDP-glycosyltransferase 76B1 n=1 Tax=Camellia lanceoleosa TaxID=1840588 RepID=A0ACC0H6R2_9ERIC|nr:UDP-glycosyltransferase 76B1 [Camellia lanceoleosa]